MPEVLRSRFWGAHVLMVLAVAATTALGLWQWNVWQDHRDAKAVDLSNATAMPLADVMGGDDPFPGRDVGRPVTLSGRWLPDSTVYVSDRRLHGHQGYWVVTPVAVDGTESAMPVVRGWAAKPSAPKPSGSVRLSGWLQASEGSGDPDEDPGDDVIPEMRVASLVQHVPTDLYSAFVVQRSAAPAPAGTEAVGPATVPEVSSTESLRNLLYALQWWVFTILAVYMWVRWCQFQLHPPEDEPDDERDEHNVEDGADDDPAPDPEAVDGRDPESGPGPGSGSDSTPQVPSSL